MNELINELMKSLFIRGSQNWQFIKMKSRNHIN